MVTEVRGWRPEGWVYGQPLPPQTGSEYRFMFCESKSPLKLRDLTDGEKDLFEQGADAMLRALRAMGWRNALGKFGLGQSGKGLDKVN